MADVLIVLFQQRRNDASVNVLHRCNRTTAGRHQKIFLDLCANSRRSGGAPSQDKPGNIHYGRDIM
jgi:hypothetical protein